MCVCGLVVLCRFSALSVCTDVGKKTLSVCVGGFVVLCRFSALSVCTDVSKKTLSVCWWVG